MHSFLIQLLSQAYAVTYPLFFQFISFKFKKQLDHYLLLCINELRVRLAACIQTDICTKKVYVWIRQQKLGINSTSTSGCIWQKQKRDEGSTLYSDFKYYHRQSSEEYKFSLEGYQTHQELKHSENQKKQQLVVNTKDSDNRIAKYIQYVKSSSQVSWHIHGVTALWRLRHEK